MEVDCAIHKSKPERPIKQIFIYVLSIMEEYPYIKFQVPSPLQTR